MALNIEKFKSLIFCLSYFKFIQAIAFSVISHFKKKHWYPIIYN